MDDLVKVMTSYYYAQAKVLIARTRDQCEKKEMFTKCFERECDNDLQGEGEGSKLVYKAQCYGMDGPGRHHKIALLFNIVISRILDFGGF